MAENRRIADSDGLHLYGWMRNVLHLSGGELITFAIVFRSSQSKSGIYTGGIPYVAEFVGCSKETARKYLHDLEAKGLIAGEDREKNGVKYRDYQVIDTHIPKNFGYIPKNLGGDTQNFEGGIPKNFGAKEYIEKNTGKNILPPTPLTPTVEEVEVFARGKGFADPRGFAEYYVAFQTENGWRTGKGQQVQNWKLNVLAWSTNHKTRIFPKSAAVPAQPIAKESLDNYLR